MRIRLWRFLPLAFALCAPAYAVAGTFSGEIVVWKVGSPHTGAVPDATVPLDLKLRAAGLERTIRVVAFPAKGFAQIFFDAFETHQEPDVLAIDNYGVVDGIKTKLGEFTGIRSSASVRHSLVEVTGSLRDLEGPRGGWEFLLSTSANNEAARRLAVGFLECDASLNTLPLPADLETVSQSVATAYLEQPLVPSPYDDPERLRSSGLQRTEVRAVETKSCGSWGNNVLAFVPAIVSVESAKEVGHVRLLLVLRKRGAAWKLLAVSSDPTTVGQFQRSIPPMVQGLHGYSGQEPEPTPGKLISPANGEAPVAAAGQRFGSFEWAPGGGGGMVAEIVEFAYRNDCRLFLTDGTGPTEMISEGKLWTTGSEWKWRVWSIAGNGTVALSEMRSFPR